MLTPGIRDDNQSSKQNTNNAVTILRRFVSGVFWILQALLIWAGLSIYFRNKEAGMVLIFIIPILLTITGLQMVVAKGITKKINTGILLIFGIFIIYFLIFEF